MLRLTHSIMAFCISTLAYGQQQSDQEVFRVQYEARMATCRIVIQNVAKLARDRDIHGMITNARTAKDPLIRIVNGYALYRLNNHEYKSLFLTTFSEPTEIPIYLTFLDAFNQQDDCPTFPGDKTPFSYWSISKLLLSMAKAGNREALRIWISYAGGDGEYGEGRSEDISEFIFTSPEVVVRNWALLHEHVNECSSWGKKPTFFQTMRKRYAKVLPKSHPHIIEIFKLIDRLEAEAVQENGESESDIVEVKVQS